MALIPTGWYLLGAAPRALRDRHADRHRGHPGRGMPSTAATGTTAEARAATATADATDTGEARTVNGLSAAAPGGLSASAGLTGTPATTDATSVSGSKTISHREAQQVVINMRWNPFRRCRDRTSKSRPAWRTRRSPKRWPKDAQCPGSGSLPGLLRRRKVSTSAASRARRGARPGWSGAPRARLRDRAQRQHEARERELRQYIEEPVHISIVPSRRHAGCDRDR